MGPKQGAPPNHPHLWGRLEMMERVFMDDWDI